MIHKFDGSTHWLKTYRRYLKSGGYVLGMTYASDKK